MKLPHAVKLVVAVSFFMSLGVCNTYAQKNIKPLTKATKVSPQEVLAKVERFVAQKGRLPNVRVAEEAPLYRQMAKLTQEAHQAKIVTPEILQLQQLKHVVAQAELETQTVKELETFVAQHERMPRRNIRAITGALNRVEDMSVAQLAEFKLACQIEYMLQKDPDSAVAQKIQALKEKWDK